jgi:import inner membrane translocase subunit TIM44
VNATGRGIEKATRPVRETQAFQNIKEVVDDGSSSRYGGWIEKEERRRKRELRDMKETSRRPVEKMEEDPKYVSFRPLVYSQATNLSFQRGDQYYTTQRFRVERVLE